MDGLTYPPELVSELLPLVVDPSDPPMQEINEMVELTPIEQREFLGAKKPVLAHGLSVFKFAYCNQRTYEEFALHMLDRDQPDLTGVFLIANDPVSHTFWHYYEPEHYDGVDPQKAARLGKLIPNLYEHNDRFLGQLLERTDSNTVVIVVSDHGFEASGVLPEKVSKRRFSELKAKAEEQGTVAIGQSGKHHLDGVLLAAGPFIQSGVDLEASIYDVVPTVLALMGLPVAKDMDGRVLTELVEPEFFDRYPTRFIDSYDDYFDRATVEVDQELEDEQAMERLRALGYID